MVGNDDRVAEAVIEVQLAGGRPGILSEAFPHVGPKNGKRAVADFRVSVEEAQCGVGGCNSCCTSSAIRERELAVLVVRAGETSLHVDLVIVVLAGMFEQAAKLQSVVSTDPAKAVGDVVDGARGVR